MQHDYQNSNPSNMYIIISNYAINTTCYMFHEPFWKLSLKQKSTLTLCFCLSLRYFKSSISSFISLIRFCFISNLQRENIFNRILPLLDFSLNRQVIHLLTKTIHFFTIFLPQPSLGMSVNILAKVYIFKMWRCAQPPGINSTK